jgi:MFS transporter, DHA1 family, multidrug resistance protein
VSPLIVLGLFEFVRGALVVTVLPLYGRFIAHFDLRVIGTAISLQYVFDNFFRIPSGWLADRFGGKWLIFIGIMLSISGLGLIYLARGKILFITGAAIFGLGIAPVWPTVVSGIAATMPSNQIGQALSKVSIAWIIGAGLGPILIYSIVGSSYKLAFGILLGVLLIDVLVLINGQIPRSISPKTQSVTIYLEELFKELWSVKVIYPGMFLQTVAIGILMPIIALYARSVLGISAAQITYLFIGIGVVLVGLLIPAGKLVDRCGIKRPLIAGLLMAATGMILLPVKKAIIYIFIAGVIIGIGYALILPSWNCLMAGVVSPQKQGTMWAVFMCIEGLGTAAGSYAGAQIWASWGYRAPFQISAMVLAAMGIFYAAGNVDKLIKAG